MNFSAVILAGGRSSRMGCDKAFLELNGQTLLARQIDVVQAAGAGEVFIAGRAEVDYSRYGGRVLADRFCDAGPLAGVEAGLMAAANSLLLVLAVDMPRVNSALVRGLIQRCAGDVGVVPEFGGAIEPLAAVYPSTALATATNMLSAPDGSRSVRRFAESCREAGLVRFVNFAAHDEAPFANWNTPGDVCCVPVAGPPHS